MATLQHKGDVVHHSSGDDDDDDVDDKKGSDERYQQISTDKDINSHRINKEPPLTCAIQQSHIDRTLSSFFAHQEVVKAATIDTSSSTCEEIDAQQQQPFMWSGGDFHIGK